MLKRIFPIVVLVVCVVGLAFAAKNTVRGDDEKPANLTLSIRDFCDPTTFNLAVGPGSCLRDDNVSVNGSQTFAGFLAELGQEKSAGAWRFNPARVETDEGINLTLVNRGGETHTFTRVAEFGGGFIAALNAAAGNLAPRPECALMKNGQLVPQAPSSNNIFINHGQTLMGPRIVGDERAKFQCCIHPWMHVTFNANGDRQDHNEPHSQN
jgi:hypothetical protein